jgi:hypothetical protein
MRFGLVVLLAACSGESGDDTTPAGDVGSAKGIVAEQRALSAGCVSVRRDTDGLVLDTITYDDDGWPLDIQRERSSVTYAYAREGANVVSMTSTQVFFDGSSKTVVNVEYDAHQHVASIDGVSLDNGHDGDVLTTSFDPASDAYFEYDSCEYVVVAEVAGWV